jgi:hypothetical protein
MRLAGPRASSGILADALLAVGGIPPSTESVSKNQGAAFARRPSGAAEGEAACRVLAP